MLQESPRQPPEPDPSWTHAREAQALYEALTLLGQSYKARLVFNCGLIKHRWHCHECGHDTDLPESCGIRLCPRCAIRRSNRFLATHSNALAQVKDPKLLTLTWQSINTLTKDTPTHLAANFASLRRTKPWRQKVAGGLAGYEFTYAPAGWHPHLHALLDTPYYSVYEIRRSWKAITHGSYIVDIRQADTENAVREVAKYVAKGSTFWKDPNLVQQYLDATYHRRFYVTFGHLYNATNPKLPRSTDAPEPPKDPATGRPEWEIPTPASCECCQSTALTYIGRIDDDQQTPEPFQIPF